MAHAYTENIDKYDDMMIKSLTPMVQVTYRVIHLADGQVESHADGAASVSVVTGFPAATQAATPPVSNISGLFYL